MTHTFGESRPDAYIRAVASAGGAGAISNVIWNYSNFGDTILTHDWYWTPYETICKDTGRHLMTFSLLDADMTFNLTSFSHMVSHLLVKQDHVVIILNSPNHNPTGYSMSDHEWDEIIKHVILESAKKAKKQSHCSLILPISTLQRTP
ncbi:aminotransferase class I/II-fold pyridoxal phosphate-dependent enzyme [Bacillus inaquosorum]|nr:aminotransferase class I/II-fold pyridoxal phosphate-dependent enzyme [Bacillus inaquosorum]